MSNSKKKTKRRVARPATNRVKALLDDAGWKLQREAANAAVLVKGAYTVIVVPTRRRAEHALQVLGEQPFADESHRKSVISSLKSKLASLDATKWVEADAAAREIAGSRVAQVRKAKGITQNELARRLKMPQSQISRLERNPDQTTIRTLKRVAKALDVDIRLLTE